MLILVRDVKTGRIIVQPPADELWLVRQKAGYGRSSRGQWHTVKSVGQSFFHDMEKYRDFRLGFDDYYDVFIWSRDAGETFSVLYSGILEVS
jgi:hypothetical protein